MDGIMKSWKKEDEIVEGFSIVDIFVEVLEKYVDYIRPILK